MSGQHARHDVPAPPLLYGMLLLIVVDAALRIFGMRRCLRFARSARLGRAPEDGSARELVHETARRVAAAAAFYPGRALCLEQSIVLCLLLRRRGVPVQLRVGVQPFPFTAHAWVEYEGLPINESEDLVTQLAPFPSFGG